ncbi:hypothetical protein BO82DRAFT_392622 [Aspergillus uvarum CBS 121591]|uniref:Uncharacterized protein n=1 Tax=Aspergillus uvarum CBS 121591 TaxID=1448315 RepID=A0A319CQY4_9EURO|nr:hypothetical protein BO82DRAFT_392622 [Aspergillus uvarum CBS 121591]PYH81213.1 hypothetical protein BO82DRAFT_392622 [Aspergillus uvarum CBS 121591]
MVLSLPVARRDELGPLLGIIKLTKDKFNTCCILATSIFSRLLRAEGPVNEDSTLQTELNQLTQRITEVDAAFWIRQAPETLAWIIFTGAAAARTSLDRGRLILYGGTVLTAVDSERLVLVRQGWVYFGLLRKIRQDSSE